MKKMIKDFGKNSLISLGKFFIASDIKGTRQLNFEHFTKCIIQNKLEMTHRELKEIFSFFDVNKEGIINYDEFLLALRGPMSDFRRSLINDAFTC